MFDFLLRLFGGGSAAKTATPADPRGQALATIRANQQRVMTPEREELIRQAMQVRRAKQQILADLDDEQRQKLAAMAIRAFLNEGRDDESAGKPSASTAAKPGTAKTGAKSPGKGSAPGGAKAKTSGQRGGQAKTSRK